MLGYPPAQVPLLSIRQYHILSVLFALYDIRFIIGGHPVGFETFSALLSIISWGAFYFPSYLWRCGGVRLSDLLFSNVRREDARRNGKGGRRG